MKPAFQSAFSGPKPTSTNATSSVASSSNATVAWGQFLSPSAAPNPWDAYTSPAASYASPSPTLTPSTSRFTPVLSSSVNQSREVNSGGNPQNVNPSLLTSSASPTFHLPIVTGTSSSAPAQPISEAPQSYKTAKNGNPTHEPIFAGKSVPAIPISEPIEEGAEASNQKSVEGNGKANTVSSASAASSRSSPNHTVPPKRQGVKPEDMTSAEWNDYVRAEFASQMPHGMTIRSGHSPLKEAATSVPSSSQPSKAAASSSSKEVKSSANATTLAPSPTASAPAQSVSPKSKEVPLESAAAKKGDDGKEMMKQAAASSSATSSSAVPSKGASASPSASSSSSASSSASKTSAASSSISSPAVASSSSNVASSSTTSSSDKSHIIRATSTSGEASSISPVAKYTPGSGGVTLRLSPNGPAEFVTFDEIRRRQEALMRKYENMEPLGEDVKFIAQEEPKPKAKEDPKPVAKQDLKPIVKEVPKDPKPVAKEDLKPIIKEDSKPVAKDDPKKEVPKPAVKEVPKDPKPVAKEDPEPVAKEVAKPVVKEVPKDPKPVAKEDLKPVVKQDPKPVAKEDPEPVAKEVPKDPKPAAKEDLKPIVKQDPKPVAKEDPKPAAKEVPKPAAKEDSKPIAMEVPKPIVKEVPKDPKPVAKEDLKPIVKEEEKEKVGNRKQDEKKETTSTHSTPPNQDQGDSKTKLSSSSTDGGMWKLDVTAIPLSQGDSNRSLVFIGCPVSMKASAVTQDLKAIGVNIPSSQNKAETWRRGSFVVSFAQRKHALNFYKQLHGAPISNSKYHYHCEVYSPPHTALAAAYEFKKKVFPFASSLPSKAAASSSSSAPAPQLTQSSAPTTGQASSSSAAALLGNPSSSKQPNRSSSDDSQEKLILLPNGEWVPEMEGAYGFGGKPTKASSSLASSSHASSSSQASSSNVASPSRAKSTSASAYAKQAPQGKLPSFGGPSAPAAASARTSTFSPAPAASKKKAQPPAASSSAATASPKKILAKASSSSPAAAPSHPASATAKTHAPIKPEAPTIINGIVCQEITRSVWNHFYIAEHVFGQCDDECSICYEEFEPGQVVATLLCHCKLHQRCIDDWWNQDIKKRPREYPECPYHEGIIAAAAANGIL